MASVFLPEEQNPEEIPMVVFNEKSNKYWRKLLDLLI